MRIQKYPDTCGRGLNQLQVDKSKFAATSMLMPSCSDVELKNFVGTKARERHSKLQRLKLSSKFGGRFTTVLKKLQHDY